MAGLLDWIAGDDQVKDAEGLTQADRRIPYWQAAQSSLAKMGGLLMAAGQPLHHDQRAQYLAQAGGALGGFSGDVMAAKSEMAKQRLAQQTVQSNRTKLATLERMKAYAQSAEGQAAMAGLKPHEQFAAKVALDGGDIDAFGKIMSGVGAAEHRDRMAEHRNRMSEIAEARAKMAEDAANRKAVGDQDAAQRRAESFDLKERRFAWEQDKAAKQSEGPFKGSGEANQMWNYLQRGLTDPTFANDPTYLAAYRYFGTQRMINGQVVDKMDLTGYPQPGFVAPGAAPPASGPASGGQLKVEMMPDGRVVETHPDGRTIIENPDGSTVDATPNKPTTRTDAPKIDPAAQRELTDLRTSYAKIEGGGQDFLKEWRAMTPVDRAKALAGLPTKAGSAWANLAALVKEKAGFNLGVLTGGDRDFITQAIADPTRLSSLGATPELVEAQVLKLMNIMKTGVDVHERNLRPKSERRKKAETSTAPGGGTKPKKYNPDTDTFE